MSQDLSIQILGLGQLCVLAGQAGPGVRGGRHPLVHALQPRVEGLLLIVQPSSVGDVGHQATGHVSHRCAERQKNVKVVVDIRLNV